MTSVNLMETVGCHTDEIIRAYEEVLQEVGYDTSDHADHSTATLMPVVAEAVIGDEPADPRVQRAAAVMLAAEARYREAQMVGPAAAPFPDGLTAP